MQLADPRFGGQAVTTTGKVYPFDDIGCLGTFVVTGGIPGEQLHSLWVTDYLAADSLLPVSQAHFLQTDSISTPMQHGLVAVRSAVIADSLALTWGATRLDWDGVLARLGPAGS